MRTTRKQLLENNNQSNELDEGQVPSEGEGDIRSPVIGEDDYPPSQSEASEEETTSNVQHDTEPPGNQTTLRKTRDEDRKKGKAVSQQIVSRFRHYIPNLHIFCRLSGIHCSMFAFDFRNVLLLQTNYLGWVKIPINSPSPLNSPLAEGLATVFNIDRGS